MNLFQYKQLSKDVDLTCDAQVERSGLKKNPDDSLESEKVAFKLSSL